MTPPISQETFDKIVQENIEDLCMEPDEALKDAIDQLNLQKANLLYIIKDVPVNGHLITKLSDSLALNQTIKDQIPLLTKIANELSTDNLPKRYYACKQSNLHSKLDGLLCKIENLENVEHLSVLLKTANYVYNGQPDWASETTLQNAVKIIKLVGKHNDNLLSKLSLELIGNLAEKHEVNRVKLYHANLFQAMQPLLSTESASLFVPICKTIQKFTVDDDIRQTSCRAHDNAREFVTELKCLEHLCKFLKLSTTLKSKKEIITTISKLLVRSEFCLLAASNECGLLELICQNLNHDNNEIETNSSSESTSESEKVLLRPLLVLLKNMCGNDEVKYKVANIENLLVNIVNCLNKWNRDASIAYAGFSCCQVLTLRSPETVQNFINLNLPESIISIMKIHKLNTNVLTSGSLLIRNMVARTRQFQKYFIDADVGNLLNEIKQDFKHNKQLMEGVKAALRDLDLDADLVSSWMGTGVKLERD